MGKIVLQNIELYAYHGILPGEKTIGGRYLVSITIDYSFPEEYTNELAQFIDYSAVYELIKVEMAKPEKLIENLAKRILTAVKENFSLVESAEIEISKLNPPIKGNMEAFKVIERI